MQTAHPEVLESWDEALTAADGWWKGHALKAVRYGLIDSWLIGAQQKSLDGSPRGADMFLMISGEFNAQFQRYKATVHLPPQASQPLSLRLTLKRVHSGCVTATASLVDETGLVRGKVSGLQNLPLTEGVWETEISIPSTSPKPTSTGCTSSCRNCGGELPAGICKEQAQDRKVTNNCWGGHYRSPKTGEALYSKAELLTLLRKRRQEARIGWKEERAAEQFISEL